MLSAITRFFARHCCITSDLVREHIPPYPSVATEPSVGGGAEAWTRIVARDCEAVTFARGVTEDAARAALVAKVEG